MSGREDSPSRSRSRTRSPSARKRSVERSFDKEHKSRSRSRSYDSYNRSRTRSYSRDRDRRRRSYRSRTRSRSRRRYSRYSRSRSRSRDRYDRYDRDRHHSSRYSRSPMSNRKRHRGSRDNPKTSKCLGVFGLSLHTQERELREVIERYGPTDEIQIVYDHQSGRSRGFAFVYMKNLDDAVEFQEKGPGTEIDGHKIRVDFSITERAHTPTPGIYFGKPTSRGYRGDRGGGDRGGGYYSRRSPSPYYSRRSRYSRSRSRSYSPRFEE